MTDPVDIPDYLPAVGRGADLFEPPALFYLTHEDRIRRWHELGPRAREATTRFLESLEPDLEAVTTPHGLVTSLADTGGNYRHFLFSAPGATLAVDKTPAIAFCFGWNQKHFRMTPNTYSPFVGVRIGPGDAGKAARQIFLDGEEEAARHLRTRHKLKGQEEWPVWTQVAAGEGWWMRLDAYREQATSALRALIDLFIPHFRRAGTSIFLPEPP